MILQDDPSAFDWNNERRNTEVSHALTRNLGQKNASRESSRKIAEGIKISGITMDISSDVRNYLVVVSEDLDTILEFNIAVNKKMIEDQKHIQQIVDRL